MKGKHGKKRGGKLRNIVIQALVGAVLLTIVLSFILARFMLSGSIPERFINAIAAVIAGITAFAVAVYLAKRMPQQRMLWGFGGAAVYAMILLLGNLLFFGIGYGNIAPVFLTVLVAGLAGSMLGAGQKKRKKYG
ncbi:MAG: TIGR04086 family membrane protein [Oscillospiraceae bacterium]|jgi:putative membrane protein (TIGR04086 family)|nr:TIGR04086 family membrane protein [Oscillospiraceae bacterium]